MEVSKFFLFKEGKHNVLNLIIQFRLQNRTNFGRFIIANNII